MVLTRFDRAEETQMLVQRWTRESVLARMAAEAAIESVGDVSHQRRAMAKLAIERIRGEVETGATTPERAAGDFDTVRRGLRLVA